MSSQLQCWLFKSLYTIAQVNTPRLTGCCKKEGTATKCSTYDSAGKKYDITEWNNKEFLNTEANRIAWKVYVDNQIPNISKLFKGAFTFPETQRGSHATISVPANTAGTKHSGYTLYGEAWKVMTGAYDSSSEAASTWLGPSSASPTGTAGVCGGTVQSGIWDSDPGPGPQPPTPNKYAPTEDGVYVKSKFVDGLQGAEVKLVQITSYTAQGYTESKLAEYTVPITLLTDTVNGGMASNILASYTADQPSRGLGTLTTTAGYSLKVTYEYAGQEDRTIELLNGQLYSVQLGDTVVLPLGVDVPIDPSKSAELGEEYTYYKLGIADLDAQEWFALTPATAKDGKLEAVDRLGVVRDTQPTEEAKSKQVDAKIADQPAGLGEYTYEDSNDVYRWNLCPEGSKLAVFAQPDTATAKWVVDYVKVDLGEGQTAEYYFYSLAFKFTQPTSCKGYKEPGEALETALGAGTDYQWKATTAAGEAAGGEQDWTCDLVYGPATAPAGANAADKKVEFAQIKFKTLDWNTIDPTGTSLRVGPIKVTLELLPATSGGYGLRAIKRVYTESGHIVSRFITDQELVQLDVIQTSPANKLVAIPAMQEITLLEFDKASPDTECITPATTTQGDAAGWAVAVGKSAKYWPPMVAELRSKFAAGGTSFYLLHSDLEVDDAFTTARDLMAKIGYFCATAKRTAVAVYNKLSTLTAGADTVYHTPGWYWSVADGTRADARYTGGMKTKTFVCTHFTDSGSLDRVWVDTTIPWDTARQSTGAASEPAWYVSDKDDSTTKAMLKAPANTYKYFALDSDGHITMTKSLGNTAEYVKCDPTEKVYFDDYFYWAVSDSNGVFSLLVDTQTSPVPIPQPVFECTEYSLAVGAASLTLRSWFKNVEENYASIIDGLFKVTHPDLYFDYTSGDDTVFAGAGWNSYKQEKNIGMGDKTHTVWWNMLPYRGYYYGTAGRSDVMDSTSVGDIELFETDSAGSSDAYAAIVSVDTLYNANPTWEWYEGENTPTAAVADGISADSNTELMLQDGGSGTSSSITLYNIGSVINSKIAVGATGATFNSVVPVGDTLSVCLTGISGKAIISHYDNSGYCLGRWLAENGGKVFSREGRAPSGVELSVVVPTVSSSADIPIQYTLPEYTWMSCSLKAALAPTWEESAKGVSVISYVAASTTGETVHVDVKIDGGLSGAAYFGSTDLKFVCQGAALTTSTAVGWGDYWYYQNLETSSCLSCTLKLVGSSSGTIWSPKTRGLVGRRPLVNKAKNRPKILGWLY